MITDERTLDLGELTLPLDAVTRTAAVVGQKGTGKTSTAVVMLEEAAAAGARFAVMDPTGAWSGLRSSADGTGPGLDCVVMGGFNGDVPLDPGAGEIVARLVVEEGYSVVCDLERMPKSEQVTFVADFAIAAYHLCRSAVTVVFDEAPRFVPQGGAGLEEDGPRCRHAVTDIVMLGRRKGLGSVLISQRPSKLHKDVLEQADLLIAHRLMGVNDRKAIAGWLEDAVDGAAALLEQIPQLERGQAVVLAPEYSLGGLFRIRAKRTFDSSATPDVGAVILDAPRGRSEIDLSALEEKMGHALTAAREDDPESLRARIRELETKLAAGEFATEFDVETDRERELQARVTGLEAENVWLRGFRDNVQSAWQRRGWEVRSFADEICAAVATLPDETFTQDAVEAPTLTPAPTPVAASIPSPNSEADSVVASDAPPLKAGMRRMLDVLARYGPLARRELAILSKVSPVSGTVSDYLSVLRQRALVYESNGTVLVSDTGLRAVGLTIDVVMPDPFTPEQVYEMWAGDLKAGARRMMDHLMRAHPDGFTRRELAGLAGISPQSGTISDYMSVLRRRGLVEERSKRVYAGSVLYLGTERR